MFYLSQPGFNTKVDREQVTPRMTQELIQHFPWAIKINFDDVAGGRKIKKE